MEQLEPELEAVMNDVIKTVNGVKGHALNTRLFRDSCEDGEAEFSGLLSHTEVKWFTRRNVQSQVWALRTEVKIFLVDQKHALAGKLSSST